MSEKDKESKEAFRKRMQEDFDRRVQEAREQIAEEKGVHPIIIEMHAWDFLLGSKREE